MGFANAKKVFTHCIKTVVKTHFRFRKVFGKIIHRLIYQGMILSPRWCGTNYIPALNRATGFAQVAAINIYNIVHYSLK